MTHYETILKIFQERDISHRLGEEYIKLDCYLDSPKFLRKYIISTSNAYAEGMLVFDGDGNLIDFEVND